MYDVLNLSLLTLHPHNGYYHFLEGNTTVLEGVFVVVNEVVVIVRVAKEYITFSKDESGAHIGYRQAGQFWVAEGKDVFCFVLQVAAVFVTEVSGGSAVADALAWRLYTRAAVVSS